MLFAMLMYKLKSLNIQINIKEIISDFELNIHNAVYESGSGVKILGCYFHLSKAIKRKIDKKGYKVLFDNNPDFRQFIKRC